MHISSVKPKNTNVSFIIADIERDIDLQLCVVNAAPSESSWWRFTTNHRTGFTDEIRMIIAFDY